MFSEAWPLGGLHENYSEIYFLVVSDRLIEEIDILNQMLLFPWKNIVVVKSQCLCVLTLRLRFLIACPEKRTSNLSPPTIF